MAKGKLSVERVKTDLQIDEHIDQQDSGWKIQAVGVVLIMAFVLAAALGIFGDGLLSKETLYVGDDRVEYEKFYRHEATMELTLYASRVAGNEATVSFPDQYLQAFEIRSVLPEPKGNKTRNSSVQYSFEGNGDMQVTFYLVPRKVGKVSGTILLNDKSFLLSHFIFP